MARLWRDRSSIFYVSVSLPAYLRASVIYIRFVSAYLCHESCYLSHETRKPNLLPDQQLRFDNITIVYIVFG